MELYKWWQSPIIHIELHNFEVVELHNYGVLSPSALHIIQQNINKTLFCKNISPQLLFLAFVFNLYLYAISLEKGKDPVNG